MLGKILAVDTFRLDPLFHGAESLYLQRSLFSPLLRYSLLILLPRVRLVQTRRSVQSTQSASGLWSELSTYTG